MYKNISVTIIELEHVGYIILKIICKKAKIGRYHNVGIYLCLETSEYDLTEKQLTASYTKLTMYNT